LQEVRIVIVGAGASGIAAASRLLENEIDDFVILEAENRYGGRIDTVRFGMLTTYECFKINTVAKQFT
jgi:monoamine oxidase